MSIQTVLNTTIYDALKGSATNAGNNVFYLQAPDGPGGQAFPLPFIIFDYVAEGDDNDNPHRVKNCVAFVRAYASTPAAAGAIDVQIDTALHGKTLSVTGWTNFQTQRESGFSLVETDAAGRKIFMSGGEYRIRSAK